MPRLLLVDDNPSIHRIAESLLAPTDVELVCVDSAAEALDRIGRGEHFDVALVDTAMPGMDGWTLLTRLRAMEATARMPIALMAGVLDPVDPSKLAKAPVQGFLKKPIELRELGDRVRSLMDTPVTPPTALSAFSTVPATPAQDLVQRAGLSNLPEFRPDSPEVAPAVPPAAAALPDAALAGMAAGLPEADDLLLLTAEDLWPEEAASLPTEAPVPDALPEVHLELEELDLESLQGLAADMPAPPAPAEEALAEAPFDDEGLVTLSGLEELDLSALPEPEPAVLPATGALALPEPPAPSDPVAAPEVPEAEPAAMDPDLDVTSLADEVLSALDLPVAPAVPEAAMAAGGQPPAAAGQAPEPSIPAAPATAAALVDGQAQAVVQAILADPVLVDALVKALVARMGDQAIREIAWEVIPDLAGRLHS